MSVTDKCEYAVLSVTLKTTRLIVFLSIVRCEDKINFHCAKPGKKDRYVASKPRVIACVGDTHRMEHMFTTEYESAILFGSAVEVTEDSEIIQALRLLCQRQAAKYGCI